MSILTTPGAKFFLLSNILHDHPDTICRTIVENIKAAMKPGYSKLLISDIILLETGSSIRQLDMDMAMFYLSGGAERTEAEWRELLEPLGLRLKFWYPPSEQNGIIDAEIGESRSN
jgi:hypothetical protein